MCSTQNDYSAQSCKFCGYLFENYTISGANPPNYNSNSSWETKSTTETKVETEDQMSAPTSPNHTAISGSSPLFMATRPLLSSILPAVIYLLILASLGSFSSLNIFTISLIAVFILIVAVPILTAPRKYMFFENSLLIHKFVGSDKKLLYSDLTLYDLPPGFKRPRIVLGVAGHTRPIGIPGNPTNKDLGESLYQFLEKSLKKQDNRNDPNQHSAPTTAEEEDGNLN